MSDPRPELTDEQILRMMAKRQVDVIAREMEDRVKRLREIAERFDGDRPAASIVADIVQESVEINLGSRLWGLVRELGRMPDPPKS